MGLTYSLPAQVTARKTAVRQVDADANGKTNPGDTLRYTITITNTSGTNLLNLQFNDTNFPNQTLVIGSIKTSPIARPDSYSAIGNTLLTVSVGSGVLTNDSDPDGDSISVNSFSPTSANGGSVTMAGNGSFTYTSAVGFTGTDTFTYSISDGNGGTSSSIVTVTVSNHVWFVNNAGPNGDGRQNSPFNSLTSAASASTTNDFIYLYQGSGNYTAGIVLKNGQQLIGSGDPLEVGGTTLLLAGVRPAIFVPSGAALTLASNNIVHGLNINSAGGRSISGASVGSLVISNVIASATGGAALNLASGTVNVTLDGASSTNSADNGIVLNNINNTVVVNSGFITGAAGGAFKITGGNGTNTYAGGISNTAGRSVDISGRNGGVVTLSGSLSDTGFGVIVQNNTAGTTTFSGAMKNLSTGANPAVTLTSNTGHTINFVGGGLNLTTTSGTGFNATGGATAINVTGASNTISSVNGTALNIANTTIGVSGLTFQSITSNGGSATGIILDNTGTNGGLTVTGTG
ncbi:MAG: cadherin-like domain-containing protein, partial [Verrucomicrobiota bacterium]|nr:cadherin-like domain-containing protein [Verrucomicrobiota bacterium]